MKRLAVFILILLSNSKTVFACVDYPYGDDIRFSLFDPQYFGFKDFTPFYYSAHYFSDAVYDSSFCAQQKEMSTGEKMNCDIWWKRCKYIPTESSIYSAVYRSGNEFVNANSKNSFVKYLYSQKDTAAISYLNFAKQCTELTDFISDPWERNENSYDLQRQYYVTSSVLRARACNDESIRLRYAFQAIRTSYYGNDPEKIKDIYAEFFSDRKEKNIIDYWAMYFRAIIEPKGAFKNYYAAQVFENAPDKRFMISMEYDRSVPVIETLRFAKNKNEKAAVWLLVGIKNPGRAMESMQNIAALKPNSEELSFLLLREMNKLEDWIYTPYYTNFMPSIEQQNSENEIPYLKMQNRIKRDRVYAQQLLSFVNLHKEKIKAHSLLWQTSEAYLMFMTENFDSSLTQLNVLESRTKNKAINDELEMIKTLCLIAAQSSGNAIIPDETKSVLLHQFNLKNQKFILAVSRELEYKGNTTDAALLLSKLNPDVYDWDNYVFWKDKKKQIPDWRDYYVDYFAYIDEEYTPDQMKDLIASVENKTNQIDAFDIWKFSSLKKQIPRLYDLLGTKYIRENKLADALASFEKVNDTLWTSKYSPFHQYLDANPFYADMYSEHRKTKGDTIRYNKESITRTLINYLSKAEDVNNKDRDYYYFLVANCYFNMTHYGNSWMMRRYYWESTLSGSELEDGKDFFNCDLAKEYYLKAQLFSKKRKFSALCLRMAGRCEKYHLIYLSGNDDNYYLAEDDNSEKIFSQNIYYKRIKKQYPAYYDDLISNCYSFDQYFNAR